MPSTLVGASQAYIKPGSPWQNGFVESFNGKLCPVPHRRPGFVRSLQHTDQKLSETPWRLESLVIGSAQISVEFSQLMAVLAKMRAPCVNS